MNRRQEEQQSRGVQVGHKAPITDDAETTGVPCIESDARASK